MVPAERTVTVAVGHGKKAARSIDAWLRQTRQNTKAAAAGDAAGPAPEPRLAEASG